MGNKADGTLLLIGGAEDRGRECAMAGEVNTLDLDSRAKANNFTVKGEKNEDH